MTSLLFPNAAFPATQPTPPPIASRPYFKNKKTRSNKLCFLNNSREASLNFLHPRNSFELFVPLLFFYVCLSSSQPSLGILQNSHGRKAFSVCQTSSNYNGNTSYSNNGNINNTFSLRIKGLQRKKGKLIFQGKIVCILSRDRTVKNLDYDYSCDSKIKVNITLMMMMMMTKNYDNLTKISSSDTYPRFTLLKLCFFLHLRTRVQF